MTVKLKDVCNQVTVGFVGSMADEYCDEGVPFLRSLNIQPFRINTNDLKYIPQAFHERIRKSTLRPGDVGIVRTGYPGTACVIPAWLEEANCSDLVIVSKRPVTTPCPRHPARIWPSPYPAAGRHVCGSSVPISLSLVVGSRVSTSLSQACGSWPLALAVASRP